MLIECPHCGKTVEVKGLGRNRLDMSVKIVCDAVRDHGTVAGAARELGCSRGYVYGVLKQSGMAPPG
jgi:molybdenum-dependent DNA-binding transcriptional regulator ModE